jgi:hypothetical protein
MSPSGGQATRQPLLPGGDDLRQGPRLGGVRGGLRGDAAGVPGPRRELHRHRQHLRQWPLREDPRRLLRGPARSARQCRAGDQVLLQPAPRMAAARAASRSYGSARSRFVGCGRTTSTSTGCTTGTRQRQSRRRSAVSTTGQGRQDRLRRAVRPAGLGHLAGPDDLAVPGFTPVAAMQIEYSLLERTVEGELIPAAVHHGIGVSVGGPYRGGRRERRLVAVSQRGGSGLLMLAALRRCWRRSAWNPGGRRAGRQPPAS